MAFFYATSQNQTAASPYQEWEVVTTASTRTRTVPTGDGAGGTVSTSQSYAVTTSADDYSLWEYAWDRYSLEARSPAASWTTTTNVYRSFLEPTSYTTTTDTRPPATFGVQAQTDEMLYQITGTGFVQALTDIATALGWGASSTCEILFGGVWTTLSSQITAYGGYSSGSTTTGTSTTTWTYWGRAGGTATAAGGEAEPDTGTVWTTFSGNPWWDTEWQTWTQPLASSAGTMQVFTTGTVSVQVPAQVSAEHYTGPGDDMLVTTTQTLGLSGPQTACVLTTYASTVPLGTRAHPFYIAGTDTGIVTTGTRWEYSRRFGGATAYREYPAWGWQMPNAMGPGEAHYEGLTGAPYGVRVVGVTSAASGGVSTGRRAFLAMGDYSTVWNGASYTYALDTADAARYSWSSLQPPATSVATGTSAVSALGAVPTGGRPATAGVSEYPAWPAFTAGAGDTVQWERGIYAMWTDTDGPAVTVTLTAPISSVLTAPLQAVFLEYWDVISYSAGDFVATPPRFVARGYDGRGIYGWPRVSPFTS